VIFLHGVAPLQVLGIFFIEEAGAAPDHEHLADLFFQRELAERLVGPLVAARRGRGVRVLGFFLGEGRQGESQREKDGKEDSAHGRNDSRNAGGELTPHGAVELGKSLKSRSVRHSPSPSSIVCA